MTAGLGTAGSGPALNANTDMTNTEDWTLRFPNAPKDGAPIEVRPHSMRFMQERTKLDFCRMKFGPAVGEYLKPETDGGVLSGRTVAEIRYGGETVSPVLFEPDGVQYGGTTNTIELRDLQSCLDNGIVNKSWKSTTLRTVYEYIFDQWEGDDLLNGFAVEIPDSIGGELRAFGDSRLVEGSAEVVAGDAEPLMDSSYVAEFSNDTPLKALWKTNRKYGLTSWVSNDRTLKVGKRNRADGYHIAAPDDHRVWRYTDTNLVHERDPVKAVYVKGPRVDEPGLETDIGQIAAFFNPFDEDGVNDARLVGFAKRNNVTDGQVIQKDSPEPKRDGMEAVAKNLLVEEIKNQNSGTVTIEPSLSGDYTRLWRVQFGDIIRMVPSDDVVSPPITADSGGIGDTSVETAAGSRPQVRNEEYLIHTVTHTLDEGSWKVQLGVSLLSDAAALDIGTRKLYYNPRANTTEQRYLTEDEFFDGDLLEAL